MLVQKADILIGNLLAEHVTDPVAKKTTVQTDKALFRQLTDKSCNVLVFHISIGVELASLSSVRSLTITHQELQLGFCLAVLSVTVAVQHVRLGNLIIALCHESHLNLVLDFLHTDATLNVQMAQYAGHHLLGCKSTRCQE